MNMNRMRAYTKFIALSLIAFGLLAYSFSVFYFGFLDAEARTTLFVFGLAGLIAACWIIFLLRNPKKWIQEKIEENNRITAEKIAAEQKLRLQREEEIRRDLEESAKTAERFKKLGIDSPVNYSIGLIFRPIFIAAFGIAGFFVVNFFSSENSIGDIPFASLTLNDILGALFQIVAYMVIFYIVFLWFGSKPREKDYQGWGVFFWIALGMAILTGVATR